MAKDVDLSSREWTDLIFEGKNKSFGAYELRTTSARRHNLAMLVVVLIIGLVVGISAIDFTKEKAGESEEVLENQQELSAVVEEEVDEEEEEEEEEAYIPPEPEEIVIPEEVANTEQNTEIIIAKDEDVKEDEQVKTVEELQETTSQFGNTTFTDGTDDVNVVREIKDEVVVEEKPVVEHKPEQIFTAVEEPPTFPGGEQALYKYLQDNLRYPETALQNGISGKVYVKFVVEKNGAIGDVQIARGKDPDLDKEAIRVVKTLPNFIPGRMNGQAVRVWYTLPINFKMRE